MTSILLMANEIDFESYMSVRKLSAAARRFAGAHPGLYATVLRGLISESIAA
jgi:hypothetical protein